MATDTQAVIVGGGVMGVSLAWRLTARGWRDVVLLEKNELTAGSTWHAAGLCTHFAHHPTIMAMRAASVRLYRDVLPAETGESAGFHPCGALRVTRSAERMDEFRHVQGLGRFMGHELRILTPEALARVYPLARTEGLLGAIHEPDDGHVDPTLATHALAAGARARGAETRRHTPVRAIERDASGAWTVHTDRDTIRCRHVVNAAGAWCREIGAMLGADLPVVPMLHQYLVTAGVPEIAERAAAGEPELPIIRDPEESWYLRQERDGFILGPYEADGRPWGVDGVPPEFGMELLPPDLDRIEPIAALAMERVPALARAGVKTVVHGPITFTPDANPLIGPAFGLDNAWLLTGSSMGVMEGGGAGRFLADWMADGAPPMDALAVDPRRFGAWAADRDYRVAKAVECFGLQFGVHYPFEERPAGRPRRVTPIHEVQAGQGAVFGCVYGWERPNWFARRPEPAEDGPRDEPSALGPAEDVSRNAPSIIGPSGRGPGPAGNGPRAVPSTFGPSDRGLGPAGNVSRDAPPIIGPSEQGPGPAGNVSRDAPSIIGPPEQGPGPAGNVSRDAPSIIGPPERGVGPAEDVSRDAPPTFGRPSWRETVAAECRAVRDRAGLVDLSAFSKFEIAGTDAPAFMERLGANRPLRAVGRIGITHALTAAGGVASEFTVTRLAADRYYLTSAAAAERHDEDLLRRHAASFADVRMVNRTAHLGVLGLMGPEAPTVLGALTDADLGHEAFPWLSARTLRIGTAGAGAARAGAMEAGAARPRTVEARALRVSYAGECGWELHVAMADLPALHEALCTAGAAVDLRPFGAYALNSLRLEKGYRAWGADLTTERTPLEAGLDHLVRTEGREFTGREALLARAESPSAWRMALLSIEPDGDADPDPFYTHTVWQGGRAVGLVTSGAPGHRTGTVLALAYLCPEAESREHGRPARKAVAASWERGRPARMEAGGSRPVDRSPWERGRPARWQRAASRERGRPARMEAGGSRPADRSPWERGRPARMDRRGGVQESGRNGEGSTLEVSILGRRRLARVLAEPPCDPADTRLRGADQDPGLPR